ncbi:MAG: N-acetyltransferase [Akkermansiaceae bacterium]|nr:N-acetyltransferase [Armatimonadota bacterium]
MVSITVYTQPFVNAPFAVLPDADAAVVATENETIVARCALWWGGNIPTLPGERSGIIGQYEATQDGATAMLLDHSFGELKKYGCTRAIGPMDGNTWRRYRFVTSNGDNDSDSAEPLFFLEPGNPSAYPEQFRAAGFTPLATYSSRVTDDMTHRDPRAERIATRIAGAGVMLRPFDTARLDSELHRIYDLSCVSFRDNFLYTPLPEAEFVGSYQRIVPYLRPDLTVMAENSNGELVGFLFALPDLEEARRGETPRTVIVKTVAVLPGREWAGLGMLLLDRCQSAARDAGFTRALHALMHDSNASRNLSVVYGGARALRRYTLYERAL